MAALMPQGKQQYFTAGGIPLVGGKVYTYAAGTTTPLATYTTAAASTPNANPVILDSRGEASIFFSAANYKIVVKDSLDSTIWTQDNLPGDLAGSLAASTGSSLVGHIASGAGAVATTVQTKLRESVSVKDFGGVVDGVTDDSVAVSAARALVSAAGGRLRFNGKAAGGTDTRALADEYVLGSAASPATGQSVRYPLVHAQVYNGTPQVGAGYAHYGHRIDYQTKTATDVQSSVGLGVVMQSYSTNSGGTATDNNTFQVAGLFNASAMDASSSAGVCAINAIGVSLYTGAIPHTLNPFQVNVGCYRTSGWYGEASKTYSAAATIVNIGTSDVTFGLGIDTAIGGVGFLHGALISGVRNCGLTIARNTITPDCGVWVSAATTYGMYIGAKSLYQLNAGQTPAFDASHNPAVGLCLGERAATSGTSNILRFASTDAGSLNHVVDISTNISNAVEFAFDGVVKHIIAPSGAILIQGNQVVSTRQVVTGSRASGAALVSLIAALAAHGLISDSTTA